MAAPPWQQAPPEHFHTQHNTNNIMYNNISPFTNYQGIFHSKTDLFAHVRDIYITLQKLQALAHLSTSTSNHIMADQQLGIIYEISIAI